VQGNFCAQCGAPAGGPRVDQPSSLSRAGSQRGQEALDENLASALCYLLGFVTGILFLVWEPYSRNRVIRFHALQSIFLNVVFVATVSALMILMRTLQIIPFFGAILGLLLIPVTGLACLGFVGLSLASMYKTYNRQRWVLPLIGELAEKQA
jgi:uncharacterized membrane protein